MKVSVLLLTYNEEANLPACLAALDWCDDIIVVDSGSTDRTVEIAKARGARVLNNPFVNFAEQRNFGLDAGAPRHEWVLHLDADEIVTPQFRVALENLPASDTLDGYRVPSKMMLFGKWLRHAGMYPSYQVRLGHARRLRFIQVGHGQREACTPERLGTFPEPYLHYSFSHGMRKWLEKHVKYAEDEANQAIAERQAQRGSTQGAGDATSRRRKLKAFANTLPSWLRPPARFLYVYFYRKGLLDGKAGLAYAIMLAVYEGMIVTFMFEKAALRPNAASSTQDQSKRAEQRQLA